MASSDGPVQQAIASTMSSLQENVKTLITTTTAAATKAADAVVQATTAAATATATATATASTTTTTPSPASPYVTISTATASTPPHHHHLNPQVSNAGGEKLMNVDDLSSSLQHFGVVDYCIFILMLVVCAAIGFYFGFIEKNKKKNRNVEQRRGSEALDYLVGGRKMKVFPVSLSLVASFVSGISLLGTSTEIYVYGTQYAFILVTLGLSGVISWYIFLPVFCNLQLTSTYEYFDLRFGRTIRLLGSTLFSIGTLVWLPIVIYVPALAFNQVTGINIHIVTPLVCLVCIFYTCVGGLKAVVWTDVIQTVIMVGSVIYVAIKCTIDVGGLGEVWQRNYDSGRLEWPEMTWDPTARTSILSMLVGTSIFFTQVTCGNQVIVQRYLSLPSLKHVKQACFWFTLGVIILHVLTFYTGLLLFTKYHDCDPITTQLAKAKDQLVSLLVMETFSNLPGMAGLFVAGVFSAALSSLSTGLNSLAAVFLEDYIKPSCKKPLSEDQTAFIMRLIVVVFGVICVGLVFVVEYLGHAVLQLSNTMNSTTGGPLLGLFLMGLLMPWINSKSAVTGCVVSFFTMAFICIRGQVALVTKEMVYVEKPVSTVGCSYDFEPLISPTNATFTASPSLIEKSFFQYFYMMTFTYYCLFGAVICIIAANLASFVFGRNDVSTMNRKLFSPCIRRFIKSKEYEAVAKQAKPLIIYDLQSDLIKSSREFDP